MCDYDLGTWSVCYAEARDCSVAIQFASSIIRAGRETWQTEVSHKLVIEQHFTMCGSNVEFVLEENCSQRCHEATKLGPKVFVRS